MNYLKISVAIFLVLAASRFIPHPPNFSSLLALSFYVPVILGTRFIPAILTCFVLTDYLIGFHSTTFFTWGSVVLIGLLSKYFNNNILSRVSGALVGCCVFFIITNFGVWTMGGYGYDLKGLIACYVFAIPFFGFTLLSTIVYSVIIETIIKIFRNFNLFKIFY